jgi:hypothetical protein
MGLTYSSVVDATVDDLFAWPAGTRANAASPGWPGWPPGCPRGRGRYLRVLTEIPRFRRAARGLLDQQPGHTGTLAAARP